MNLHCGDCFEVMQGLPDNSVELVLTDPPYGLAFMGKKWDYDVPPVHVWAEALRVLKPGGHLLAFAGTRTQHRMACRIEDAGFEIRDMLAWVYGQGFPKSHNGPWGGTALKPALEPITMARKPLVGTVADNVMQYGTGGLNIDACRVGTEGGYTNHTELRGASNNWIGNKSTGERTDHGGRWPANLLHDGSEEVKQPLGLAARFFYCAKASKRERDHGCEGMAARFAPTMGNGIGGKEHDPETATPKANHHPTVKPIALMEYLVQLASRPGAVVLDPFMGSGTTGIACRNLGREFIGIERDADYFEIAKRRIEHEAQQMELPA